MAKKTTKLGRPPASSSAETRGRIIDVARTCFAELGYEATTNRALAADANITTGAIYHYFESKLDIFRAVHDEVQERVYVRFRTAESEADTFVAKLESMFETAHELNKEDPTLAQFLGASRIDLRRVPELIEAFPPYDHRRNNFFDQMVDFGVKSGEIKAADRERMKAIIYTLTIGLTDAVSNDIDEHRLTVDGLMALIRGELIQPTKKSARHRK